MQSCDIPPNQACARVIVDAVLGTGLDTLTGGKRAFFNISRDALLNGAASLLPVDQVVIELLEDVAGDTDVLNACRALKGAGYVLALDEVSRTDALATLMPLVNYVKIDFRTAQSPAARRAIVDALLPARPCFVAEKIETHQEFAAAAAEGFGYFQGFFLGRPARAMKHIAARGAAYASLLVKLWVCTPPHGAAGRLRRADRR